MKYTTFAYKMICLRKRCVTFDTYERSLTYTTEWKLQ